MLVLIKCLILVGTISMGYSMINKSSPPGYIVQESTGHAFRIVYHARDWPVARERCSEQGAKLAVPKSQEEFDFLQHLVRGMQYASIVNASDNLLVWLGISNRDDHHIWSNVDGEDITESEFHKWVSDNGSSNSSSPVEPHCAAMDAFNKGLRDYWCHLPLPFICQKS